ncbi:hypothetical protein [Limnoglobus roseus]|uniref:Uncharacterized protein n=1 Tax=Limnoglobus roseus TaxID=2598579 RepID=A0A5C1AHE1_9BACT|nr:hypothetical protein [Limnoglobus roseus]QEL16534.1 hypothetical protein PX52LOC_03493 [Limnoglobus roseus]
MSRITQDEAGKKRVLRLARKKHYLSKHTDEEGWTLYNKKRSSFWEGHSHEAAITYMNAFASGYDVGHLDGCLVSQRNEEDAILEIHEHYESLGLKEINKH